MAREARLRLAQHLAQVGHAEGAAGAEREQPEPRRLGGGAKLCEDAVHGLAMT